MPKLNRPRCPDSIGPDAICPESIGPDAICPDAICPDAQSQ